MKLESYLAPEDYDYLKKISKEPSEKWFRNVYIYITEKCQLRCKHCYLGRRLDKEVIMSKDDIFRNLVLWKKIGGKKLCFLGGEPTLHPQFEEIIKYANGLKYEEITMDSNGQQIALEKLKNMNSADFTYIQVSLDGGSALTNDKTRGKGTFATAMNTIKELRERNFDIRIICTVNNNNIEDCLKILSIADDLGVSLVKYHIFSGIGSGKENADLLINPKEWIKFYNLLLKQKGKYKARIQYQVAYGDTKTKEILFDQNYDGCLGRKLDRMSVFPNGNVYICSYLFDTDLNFAQVDLKNNKLIINKDRLNELSLFHSGMKKCDHCNFFETCFMGCQAEKLVNDFYPCIKHKEIYPVCRLWKADV